MRKLEALKTTVGVIVLGVCLWLPAAEAQAGSWAWSFTPYLWASDITLDLEVNGDPVLGVEADFSDLLDKVDFVFQGHLEGQKGKGGFFLDLTYLDLGDTKTASIGPPPFDNLDIRTDNETIIVEAAGFYRPSGESTGFDVLFGVRIIDIDMKADVTLSVPPFPTTRLETSTTFTDAMVGVRYSGPIGENWQFMARGDIAGGDTEGTWNVIGGFGYLFGRDDRFAALFGYRHMEIELEDESAGRKIETEMTMSGPIVAFRFGWGQS